VSAAPIFEGVLSDALLAEPSRQGELVGEVLELDPLQFEPLERFIDPTSEDSAEPLLGEADDMVLGSDGLLIAYGDGGAGKTTLSLDATLHLASGKPWLGIDVPRPANVLVIENEGPRGPFRAKLNRKLASWNGPAVAGRVHVLSAPWGRFSFAESTHRLQLAAFVESLAIDVLVCGPLVSLGAIGGGTPEEVTAFEGLLLELRALLTRGLAVWLAHHENKAGDVSGAWERLPDTLLHVRSGHAGHQTELRWRKARWSSRLHGQRWTLNWCEGESYELVNAETKRAKTDAQAVADRDWIVERVRAYPGEARGKVETAFYEAHGERTRARGRRAIDAELAASSPRLAKGSGPAFNGVYLYPAAGASLQLADGETASNSEDASNLEPGRVLAARRSPVGGEGESGELRDGACEQELEWA